MSKKVSNVPKKIIQSKNDIINEMNLEIKSSCLKAVKKNGMILDNVPEYLQDDYDMCLAAVKQNGLALDLVSPKMKENIDICLVAIKQNIEAFKILMEHKYNNGYDCDYEIYMKAVKQNGLLIEYVMEEEFEDVDEICLVAVKQNGLALEFVHHCSNYIEICLAAIKQNSDSVKFMINCNLEDYTNYGETDGIFDYIRTINLYKQLIFDIITFDTDLNIFNYVVDEIKNEYQTEHRLKSLLMVEYSNPNILKLNKCLALWMHYDIFYKYI